MVIAGAQIRVQDGAVRSNLEVHYHMIEQAASLGVQLIVFPVMSLTGYQRLGARELAFSPNDSRLQGLATLASEKQIFIMAGAPLWRDQRLFIGAFILGPSRYTACYIQQFLHMGETAFFDASLTSQTCIDTGSVIATPALGCDVEEPLHLDMVIPCGAEVYTAGLFATPTAIDKVHSHMAQTARKAHWGVVMANYCGNTWGQVSAGKSACWDPLGRRLATLPEEASGLVLLDRDKDQWVGTSYLC